MVRPRPARRRGGALLRSSTLFSPSSATLASPVIAQSREMHRDLAELRIAAQKGDLVRIDERDLALDPVLRVVVRPDAGPLAGTRVALLRIGWTRRGGG